MQAVANTVPSQNTAAERAAERKAVLADRYKTRMCRNYEETGRCPYENKCMFAHGDAELRTTEMNLEEGLVTEEAIKAFQRLQLQKKQAMQAPAAPQPPQPQESPVKRSRSSVVVRQHDVYAHQPYVAPSTAYGYGYGYGACQCPECLAYAPPVVEETCQCADCVAYYKQYGYTAPTAPAVMEP